MKLDFDLFKKLPASQLQDVTPTNSTPGTGNPTNGASAAATASPGAQTAQSAQDIYNTGNHTETPTEQPINAPAAGSGASAPRNPGQKSLSELTAGKAGKFGVDLMNIIMPAALVFLYNRAGYKIDKKVYKLLADEREAIAPAMQAVMDTIMIDMNNPYFQLLFVVGIVYGSKTMEAIPEAKKIVKEKEAEKIDEKNIVEVKPNVKNESVPTQPAESFEEAFEREIMIAAKKAAKSRKKGIDEAIAFVRKTEGKQIEMRLKKNFLTVV